MNKGKIRIFINGFGRIKEYIDKTNHDSCIKNRFFKENELKIE